MRNKLIILLVSLFLKDMLGQSWIQKADCTFGSFIPNFFFSCGTNIYVAKKDSVIKWNQTTNTWSFHGMFPGTATAGAVAQTYSNGKAYVISGSNSLGYTNEVWEFDPILNLWTQKANFPGAGRRGHSVAFNSVNNCLYLSFGNYLSDFWQYNPTPDTWIQKSSYSYLMTGRTGHVSYEGSNGTTICGWGDQGSPNNFAIANFAVFTPATNTWVSSAPAATARRNASVFTLNGITYGGLGVLGGSPPYLVYTDFNILGPSPSVLVPFPGISTNWNLSLSCNGGGYIGLGQNVSGSPPFFNVKQLWEFLPQPTVALGTGAVSSTICSGSSLQLFASGASNYTWTPGNMTGNMVSVSPTVTTSYSVIGTTTLGSWQNTITITVIPTSTINVIASQTIICAGQTVTLSATGGNNNYSWMPGSLSGNSVVVTPTIAQTYTVKSGSCASQTVSLGVIPAQTLTVNSLTTICNGESVILSASGSQSYTWTPGNLTGSITVTPTSSIVYTVDATCANQKTVSITVAPETTINIPNSVYNVCLGSPVSIQASGAASYTWNPGGSGGSALTLTPNVSATYTVEGTNLFGCASSATVDINVLPLPQISVLATPSIICSGNSSTISCSGAVAFTVSGMNTVVSPTVSTTYSVMATNSLGCVSSEPAIYNLIVNPLPLLSITGNTKICSGSSTTLVADGGLVSYAWSSGGTGPSISVSPATNTTYAIIVSDSNGCENSATIAITVLESPQLTVNSSDAFLCSGETATLTITGANTYTWDSGSNGGVHIVSPVSTTIYSVIATSTNGCEKGTTFTQEVSECLSVENLQTETNEFQLYPNPGSDQIVVDVLNESVINMWNSLGESIIMKKTLSAGKNNIEISQLAKGIYFYKITDRKKSYSGRFIKN